MRHGIAGCALLCLFPACSDKVQERPCPIDRNSALYEVAETLCDGVDMHRLTLHRLTLHRLTLHRLTLHRLTLRPLILRSLIMRPLTLQ